MRGCLLGGAVGDALGAPVEFMALDAIRQAFGPAGIRCFAPAYGRIGAITDDTQMTLFTAEGLIRAWVRGSEKGICHTPSIVHHAYLRWLLTQGDSAPGMAGAIGTDGWLFALPALHHPRAPGNTCLSALRAARGFGTPAVARNDSKGCGGVMRVAPVGLLVPRDRVFTQARDIAALTHGHPTGALAAGHFAVTVAELLAGKGLVAALDLADAELRAYPHHAETAGAIRAARILAAKGPPSPEALEALGGGWVAEEALAIAICCALAAEADLAGALILAANHSGDTDSTAAIAGNLLGTLLGEAAIPQPWLAQLELADAIGRVADDLHDVWAGALSVDQLWGRYPGW